MPSVSSLKVSGVGFEGVGLGAGFGCQGFGAMLSGFMAYTHRLQSSSFWDYLIGP